MPLPPTQHVQHEAAGTDTGGEAQSATVPETFSREYVAELRSESANYRKRAQEAEHRAKDAEARVAASEQAANQRIVLAELRTAAVRAGMVDLDGLKLADLEGVTLDEAGHVRGTDELMETMKKAKPYLFRSAPGVSTSSTQPAPRKEKPRVKTAMEMSGEEWQATKKELGLS